MSDVVTYTEAGRTYRISGLQAKAQAISGASQEMDTLIDNRITAANNALAEWKGPHAVTFVEDVNGVLSKMTGLRISLWHASNVLASFPEQPRGSMASVRFVDDAYMSATLPVPSGDGTASANPPQLRNYLSTSWGQDGRFGTLAGMVNLDGVTAEVSYHRDLTPAETQQRLDSGIDPDVVARATVLETEPVSAGDLAGLIPLPSPKPDVPPLVSASQAAAEFAGAVATAFENADQRLLSLLAQYPDLAGFVVAGIPAGRLSGGSSLALLLAYFPDLDTNHDGLISQDELGAAARNGALPAYVQQAANYLKNNPVLFGLAETVGQNDALGIGGDHKIPAGDIRTFLEFNVHLRTLAENFAAFDTAAHGGRGDGNVGTSDLQALAAGTGPLADAARWLLSHDTQRDRLATYAISKERHPEIGYGGHGDYGIPQYPTDSISRSSLIGLAFDQQIFGDDPAAAAGFVNTLPIPRSGEKGIPIWLVSDEGAKATVNAALVHTVGDLTDTHSVIAHLPETEGGVRNSLITGFYDLLAGRADTLFAGPVAGDPQAPGHPGSNWAHWGTFASEGVRGLILGDVKFGPFSVGMDARQAAADGNQWIFNDLGGDFAAFIEMYERNPNPSENEMEAFFGRFEDGDGHTRTGFATYVAAMEETDPARRQQLLFQGNGLMATHEQAGIQPYLETIFHPLVPDELITGMVKVQLGTGAPFHTDKDVPDAHMPNNYVDDVDLLGLDPAGKDPSHFSAGTPGATRFAVGSTSAPGVVNMAPIAGVEAWSPDFPTSTRDWWQNGGEVTQIAPGKVAVPYVIHPPADESRGSAAIPWSNPHERMYYVLKLFEQHHSDPLLYQSADRNLNLDDIGWLEPATGLK